MSTTADTAQGGVVEVRLSTLIGPAFYSVHHAIKAGKFSEFILCGGRGSLKSSFTAVEFIQGIVGDPEAYGVALRKVGNTIRDSVLATFEWAIGKMQMALLWTVTKAPAELVFKLTGQKIICRGLDEPLKLKSIKPRRGYFKFLWFEEGQEYNGWEEIRSVFQSVLRGGKKFCVFFTFNPPKDPNHWVNKEAMKSKPDRLIHHSNYKQVPTEWLGPKFLADAALLEQEDPVAHANEYMGLAVGNSKEVIFSGKCKVQEFAAIVDWEGPYIGVDWGFSQDPLVILKCWIETLPLPAGIHHTATPRQRLYVEFEESGVGIELDDTAAVFERIPGAKRYKIRCDNARPESIAFMRKRGFDCVAVEKGPDTVEAGVSFLLNFSEIVVHPRCAELVREIPLYKYKVDKNTRDVLPDIADKDNHAWDALRYAIEPIIKRKKGFFS